MERNLSLENRLSFNRPIAESTFRASISNSPSFQWGRKNLNSSISNRSPAKSPVRERTGLSKIDARIYADVQSRGLTSRIVKYHESGTKLNRSISMSNLSSESRQFPAARTTKPELPYKASKQNVSMTHIAPPDKSVFYGNTLSGLLRSSSVISLQHNDDDISSENRPIIHPPGTEKELQPTRSVLEVLKEISRKRINNEDADESDTSKKYCNRVDGDMNGTIPPIIPDYRNIMQTPQTYKRQRESAAECYHLSRNEQNALHAKPAQSRPEAPSPEQDAKRRHCNYNNDITSSLSSSKKSTNKRKLFDYDGDKQHEKQLRFQPEIRLPELSTALSYVAKTPITPIPNTPQTGLNHCISSNEIPLAAPVQKSLSAPEATDTETMTRKVKALPEKPKLTLFNKNYDSNSVDPTDDRALEVEDDAYAGIQFVKPKKSSSVIGGSTSHLLMERTQKSKLALMLSGLRGELYLGDEEEKSAKIAEKKVEEAPINAKSDPPKAATTDDSQIVKENTATVVPTSTSSATSAGVQPTLTTSLTVPTNKTNTNVVDGAAASSNAISLSTNKPSTTTTPTKISSPLTGIKLTPQTTTTSAVASVPPAAPVASVAPTFSFGIGTAAPSTSTTNSIVSKPSAVSIADSASKANNPNLSTQFSFGTTTQTTTANQSLLPTFGEATGQPKLTGFTMKPAVTAATTSAAPTNSLSTLPPAFAFNSNNKPATDITASTAQPTPAAQPLFAFGNTGKQPTPNASSTITPPNSESSKPTTTTTATPFSFGANKSSGGFSFGAAANTSTANATPATEAPKMFSFTSPKTSTAAGGFSFGGNTFENKSAAPNVFGNNAITPIKFGATASTEQQQQQAQPNTMLAQPAANNSAFAFGSKPTDAATQQKTVASNTFGGLAANNNNQAQPFSFGTAVGAATTTAEASKTANIFSLPNNASNKPFSFGGSTANTTNPATATTTNTFSLANNNNNNNNNNQQSNLFSFGGSSANATAAPTEAPKPNNTFSFGGNAQSKPFSFGGSNAEANKTAFGSGQNKAFSFGNAANNTIATTDAAKPASTFNFSGSNQSNAFSFGGVGNQPKNPEPPKMISNSTTNNPTTNAFAFGATKSPLNQASAFGAAPSNAQNNVFSFSGGANNNGATPTTANDASSAKPLNPPTFNAFANAGQGNTFTFGSSNNAPPAAAPSMGSTVAKPTTFGVGSNTGTQSSAFMFGGGSNNNATPAASTNNLFAMPTNVNNNPPPPFGGATNTTVGTPASSNIFAASPSSSDRPIRRATRRLTKF